MDIILPTNYSDHGLSLLCVKRFADGSGYCAQLAVHSYGFRGEQQFCLEVEPFREFVEALQAMNRTLAGKARLQARYEPEHVELELSRTGSVWVRGELRAFIDEPQSLKLAFRTDQTCLGPFVAQLQKCLDMAVT
jgi:hypothetical protein